MKRLLLYFICESEKRMNFTNISDMIYYLEKYQKSPNRAKEQWMDLANKAERSLLKSSDILQEIRHTVKNRNTFERLFSQYDKEDSGYIALEDFE